MKPTSKKYLNNIKPIAISTVKPQSSQKTPDEKRSSARPTTISTQKQSGRDVSKKVYPSQSGRYVNIVVEKSLESHP